MKYKDLYKKYGKIKIKCEAKDSLPIEFITDFQGDLKKRTKENKIKLATQIFKNGFIAPFFIWKNKDEYKCIDGHARSEVLCEIKNIGIPIPGMFPVIYIEAENKEDAREKLLSISSQYGEWNVKELDTWLENIDAEIKETLRFVDKEINKTIKVDFEAKKNKKKKCPECGHEF